MAGDGWVKSWRQIKNWQWYTVPNMAHLFQHLIREANHKDKYWQKILVKRGQLVTGLHKLNVETGISVRSLRTCIDRLISTSEITSIPTNRYRIITINNYGSYQGDDFEIDKQIDRQFDKPATSQRQASDNKQELKNVKKEYSPNSDGVRLSKFLLAEIRKRKSNFRQPNLQKWAVHIDRLIRLDHRTPEQIETVMRWCQQDDFWQNNILSTEKLRKQIDKLELAMGKGVRPATPLQRGSDGRTPGEVFREQLRGVKDAER